MGLFSCHGNKGPIHRLRDPGDNDWRLILLVHFELFLSPDPRGTPDPVCLMLGRRRVLRCEGLSCIVIAEISALIGSFLTD